MECGLVGDGEPVLSHGKTAPLLEPVDASFDRVALLVCVVVENRWATAGSPSPQAVTDLVGGLRNDSLNAAPAQMRADARGSRETNTHDPPERPPAKFWVSRVRFVEPGSWP